MLFPISMQTGWPSSHTAIDLRPWPRNTTSGFLIKYLKLAFCPRGIEFHPQRSTRVTNMDCFKTKSQKPSAGSIEEPVRPSSSWSTQSRPAMRAKLPSSYKHNMKSTVQEVTIKPSKEKSEPIHGTGYMKLNEVVTHDIALYQRANHRDRQFLPKYLRDR